MRCMFLPLKLISNIVTTHQRSFCWCPGHDFSDGSLEVLVSVSRSLRKYRLHSLVMIGGFLCPAVPRGHILLQSTIIKEEHLIVDDCISELGHVVWRSRALWWIVNAWLLRMFLGLTQIELWCYLRESVDSLGHHHHCTSAVWSDALVSRVDGALLRYPEALGVSSIQLAWSCGYDFPRMPTAPELGLC